MFAIKNAKVPGAVSLRSVAAVAGGVRAAWARSTSRSSRPLAQQMQPVESWASALPAAMPPPPSMDSVWTPPYTPPPRRDMGVGILAAEVYVPSRCVNQASLEAADAVGEGKYTVGLGQSRLAFLDDREDINSMCLTACQGLMDKYGISARDIGRIDVGTETVRFCGGSEICFRSRCSSPHSGPCGAISDRAPLTRPLLSTKTDACALLTFTVPSEWCPHAPACGRALRLGH